MEGEHHLDFDWDGLGSVRKQEERVRASGNACKAAAAANFDGLMH